MNTSALLPAQRSAITASNIVTGRRRTLMYFAFAGTVLDVRDGTAIFELSTTSALGEANTFSSVVVATLVALPTMFVSLVVRISIGVVVESHESMYELAETCATIQITRAFPMPVVGRLARCCFSVEPFGQSETSYAATQLLIRRAGITVISDGHARKLNASDKSHITYSNI